MNAIHINGYTRITKRYDDLAADIIYSTPYQETKNRDEKLNALLTEFINECLEREVK